MESEDDEVNHSDGGDDVVDLMMGGGVGVSGSFLPWPGDDG
jgi:hypothetical protein